MLRICGKKGELFFLLGAEARFRLEKLGKKGEGAKLTVENIMNLDLF
jgi:hypothetical protein